MSREKPRIALIGFNLESNRWAPVVGRAAFEADLFLRGDELLSDARSPNPRAQATMAGFVATMDKTGPWEPLPIVSTSGGAAGPADHAFFQEFKAEVKERLARVLPVDGVYFSEHGAAVTTEDIDPDGTLFQMVRDMVGPGVPVVSTLDLHANISDRMVAATDILIGYLTNPHVDQRERGIEAGGTMRALLAGTRTAKAFIRLPLIAPNVTQRTDIGPLADAIREGQALLAKPILNVTIAASFAQGDIPDNGIAIVVTADGDVAAAQRLCRTLAQKIWDDRHRFVPHLTPLEDCVRMALDVARNPAKPPILIADPADNPGSGARGNTTWLLDALYKAGAEGVALSTFFDPPLAAEAHRLGAGAKFEARFNRDETSPTSKPFSAPAEVLNLSDGTIVGQPGGVGAGRTIRFGPSAALQVGGIRVVVTSHRRQCLDTAHFEGLGVPLADARVVVVKSRGHFRAGFKHLFPDERIFEADLPGLSSPNLSTYDFRGLKRPIFPLDPDTAWMPPAW